MKALLIVFILLSSCNLFTPKSEPQRRVIDIIIEKQQNKIMEEFHKGNVPLEILFDTMFIIKYNLEIRINPKDKYSYLQRAHHKALIGDFKGAILDYDKLIEFSHKDSVIFFAYEGRGDAKSEIEDYEGAIVDYNKAIAQYPSRSTFLQRGKARYKLGDIKNACLDWKKVEPLEWEYSMDSDYSDSPDDTYDEAIELRKKYCR